MRPVLPSRSLAGAALAILTLGGVAGHAQQPPQSPPATPVPPVQAPSRDSFAGTWEYNADDSVNAATGRPELGGSQRRIAPQGSSGGTSGGSGGSAAGGSGVGGAGGGVSGLPPSGGGGVAGGGNVGGAGGGGGNEGFGGFGGGAGSGAASIVAAQELRDTQRDLLEVPRRLTIAITADAVAFKDDLNRERTYSTTGKKQKYQLGAASYTAKAHWDGPQLIKELEAAYGFKMTETYSVSSDGQRLFVIVRVGDARKDARPNGANRVYDRVQSDRQHQG